MFLDTSVIVAILSQEEDAKALSEKMRNSRVRYTSPLVVLETTMRLTTKLSLDPLEVERRIEHFLQEAGIGIIPIDEADGRLAVRAFRDYGKGRGHPAQLNLADCLSYACARNRGLPLLYKGEDFGRTDLA